MSGAGKSTLCDALSKIIKPVNPRFIVIDGDEVRAAFGNDLGFTESDRHIQVRRIQAICKILGDQDLIVAVAVLYSHEDLLAWNRKNLSDYVEIYLKSSLKTIRDRDPKALYAKALAGEITNMVGLDIPWHEPKSPDLVLDADAAIPPADMAHQVIRAIPGLNAVLQG